MGSITKGYADRLRSLIGPITVRAFAREVGIKATTLQNQLKGATPGIDSAAQIARAKGVSLNWLITGEGTRDDLGRQGLLQPRNQLIADVAPDDFTLVPRLDVQAAAGAGALTSNEEAVDFLAFQTAWLRRRGVNPAFARILTARGDSMEPTIRDSDALLADSSIDRIVDNAIYVVIVHGLVVVKRVQTHFNGSVILISDNERYGDETVSPADVPQLSIAGRVMWYGRSI